jgi:hypothetical protein
LVLGLSVLPSCSGPPPFVGRDASTDTSMLDAGRTDVPYVRPDAPLLPPADLEVILPYGAGPVDLTLEVEAGLAYLDVVFSVDATGSFGGEIDALQRSLEAEVLPSLEERVREVAVGIARFEDFPVAPFGVDTDQPFELITAVTTDRSRIRGALAELGTRGNGGDLPESGAEALYQLGTGEGFVLDGLTLVPAFSGGAFGGGDIGGAGFRAGSFRVVVHVTDAPTHEPSEYGALVPDAHSSDEAIAALRAHDVRVLGIASNEVARTHLERIALATGASAAATGGRCATGLRGAGRPTVGGICPLVFDIGEDGQGLSTAIVDAIAGLLDTLSWREAHGESVDDRYGFVESIEASGSVAPAGSLEPAREDRIGRDEMAGTDGVLDTFLEVATGTTLQFTAHLSNRTIAPADYDQIFRVGVRILGDGVVLEERTIRVIVPRGRLDAGVRDAGAVFDGGLDAGLDAPGPDAGEPDAGAPDAPAPDASEPDAG